MAAVAELLSGAQPDEPEGEGEAAAPAAENEGEAFDQDGGVEGDGAGGDGGEDVETVQLSTLNDVADALGVDVSDLYKLKVNMPGESGALSLGELKDQAGDTLGKMARESVEAEFQAERDTLRSDKQNLARDRQLLSMAIEETRAQLSPALLQKLEGAEEERLALERRHMFRTLPKMQDPNERQRFRDDSAKFLGEVAGIEADQVDLRDHKYVLLLDWALERWRSEKAFRANPPKPKRQPQKAARGTAKPRGNRNAQRATGSAVYGEVAKLLSE